MTLQHNHARGNVATKPLPPTHGGRDFFSFAPLRLACLAIAFGLGALGMTGWLFNEPHLRSLFASSSEMKPNTALALMLLSFAILVRGLRQPSPSIRSLAHVCAGAAAVIGALTLLEYFTNSNFSIDEFLFEDIPNPVGTSHPGRMSPPTAWCFLFGACAVFLLDAETRIGTRPSDWLALIMAAIPAEILLRYIYGNLNLLAFGPRLGYMAVPTAVALLAIPVAILLHTPERGLMRPLTVRNPAGRLFRRLLVGLFILPPALGWFVLVFLNGRAQPAEFGISETVILSVFILGALAWFSAAKLSRSQELARATEVSKSAILESALDCIVMMDQDGRITEFNPAAEATFGWKRAEILGKTVAETIVPPELRAAHIKGLARFHQTGTGPVLGRRVELTGLRADGSRFPTELAILVTRVEGAPPFFTAYLRDISERKEAERSLAERARLLNLSFDAIIALDPSGRIRFWNKGAEEMYGWTAEEAMGQVASELLRSEFPMPREQLWESLTREGRWSGEMRHCRKDRSYLTVLTRWALETDAAGKPAFILETGTDITGRKKAQADLERSELLLRTVTNEARVGLVLINQDRRYVFANSTYAQILNLPSGDVVGQRVPDVLPGLYDEN